MVAPGQSQKVAMRRIRPVERQPMKEWITELLDSGEVSSLSWTDKSRREFRIKWCHGSRHGWSIKDADLFERWAIHTGRYYFGGKKDPKRWKANFRCALNSLKTIEEVRDKSQVKGSNACRIYRMVDMAKKEPKLLKEVRQANKTSGKQMLSKGAGHKPVFKYEGSTHDEEMTSDSDSTNEEIEQICGNRPHEPVDNQITDIKKERNSCLPNFDKISPGIDKIEFGRMHCRPNHSCGFTVNLGTSPSDIVPNSPVSNVKISLPENFMRQISGSDTPGNVIPDFNRTNHAPVVFPESPEASDASPQSAGQEEEMVEINFFEVSEEVTISSTDLEDSRCMLNNHNEWQPTDEQYQTVSKLVEIMASSGEMQQQTLATCDWPHGYSPLTPP